MYVRDFYSQAKREFAACSEAEIFARLSDASKLLANKGINDPLLGEIELCVCDGCITLPRDVGTVLAIDVCGQPTLLQDQFFKYHINGPGVRGSDGGCGVITEMGQVCTMRDPAYPAYLTAEVTSAADNNKKLRVFATRADNGQKIFTPGPDGKLYEGFLVPMIFGYPQRNPDVPALGRIYRVSKETTKDFVKLYATKTDGTSQTLVGWYEPDETEPQYRRIKTRHKSNVLVKYKKATLEIRSMSDWLNFDNFEALRLACRAVKYRMDDRLDDARKFEEEASRILSEETAAKRPAGPRVPQVINGVYRDDGESLIGYGGCWGGGRW